MGIIVSKRKYTSLPTEDTIKVNVTPYTDGVPVVPYTDTPIQYSQMSTTLEKDRYAFTGDVV
jgi:hypothetical protein